MTHAVLVYASLCKLQQLIHESFPISVVIRTCTTDPTLEDYFRLTMYRLRVYAAPFLSEESGLEMLSSQGHMLEVFECLNYCSQQQPNAAAAVPVITSLVQQARNIYIRQRLSQSSSPASVSSLPADPIPPPLSDSIDRVQRFKETLESFPPDSPGEQVLIWASFIAASDCTLQEHKSFFENFFLRHFVKNGFLNALSGLRYLQSNIWRRDLGASWTALLPQVRVFIM